MKKFLTICLILLIGVTCIFADSNTTWKRNDTGVYHITEDVSFMPNKGETVLFEDTEDGAVMVLFNTNSEGVAYAITPIITLSNKVSKALICDTVSANKPNIMEVRLSKFMIDDNGNYCFAFLDDYKIFKYYADNYNSFDTVIYFENGDILAIRCNSKTLSLYL